MGQVAGLFYILMGGLLLALAVALFEFFQYGRVQAAKANIPLRAAFKAKSRLPNLPEIKTTQRPAPQREQERIDWNSGPYSGVSCFNTTLLYKLSKNRFKTMFNFQNLRSIVQTVQI